MRARPLALRQRSRAVIYYTPAALALQRLWEYTIRLCRAPAACFALGAAGPRRRWDPLRDHVRRGALRKLQPECTTP